MPRLILDPGRPTTRTYHLPPGTMTLGRAPDNHISVLHESVSRRHAQIDVREGRVFLTDLKSTRGTFVNGLRVSQQELRGGEVIHLGEILFSFLPDDDSPAPAPPSIPKPAWGGPAPQVLSMPSAPGGLTPTLARGLDTGFLRATLAEVAQARAPAQPGPQQPRLAAEQKLRTLVQVGQILSGPEPTDALLGKILDLVFRILDVSRAVILLADEATGQLVPRVSRPSGLDDAYSHSIVNYVRQNHVAALFSDAAHDERLNTAQSVLLMSIRTAMAVPLKARDRLLGVLYLDNVASTHAYTEDDLEFAVAFAGQASIALENALLYRQIEREAVLRSHFERFFPPTTAKKIVASSSGGLETIDAEVTALFADISGYTAMVSGMPPRDVVSLLNEYFAVVSKAVFQHEGTLEKYIGDALLAVWGAPFSHPEDVDRALRAAVDMQLALLPFNESRIARGQPPLLVHIGLNTGMVAAGNIGSEQYLQYATIGDTTNVASRICSAAEAGEILISASTHARLRQRPWPLEPLPPVPVKGKAEPLVLFRVRWKS